MIEATDEAVARAVAEAWPAAQARWSPYLLLSRPVFHDDPASVAHIHLGTRQISLNAGELERRDLLGSIEAILAHEVGHHVKYPATLAVSARLHLLERPLLPIEGYSFVNLFTDVMINEHLGHALSDQLSRVYASFRGEKGWERDPSFLFYLAVYEELWRREPGELMGPGRRSLERRSPAYRADAQMLAQNLFVLGPNIYTQFLYFVSIVSRYVKPFKGKLPVSADPYSCGADEPTPDDWADALTPTAREIEAVRRALAEGWISQEVGDRLSPDDLERRVMGLPGQDTASSERVPEIMAAYYRQQAERHLVRPPPLRGLGEAIVPTTLEDWEAGEPVQHIDWVATLLERGDVLGAAQPLRRERIADMEGYDVPLWQPRTEIYLDVSGSMPDPRRSLNAMTLAAQIVTLGTVRAGGWVRALLYSTEFVSYWTWCRSETEMSRFLMHYIGAGTSFPFGRLAESVRECGEAQPIRVIITDTDFDHNHGQAPAHAAAFSEAARRSARLILLQHGARPEPSARYRREGAEVVAIERLEDFPRLTAGLTRALFSGGGDGHDQG
jgi:hypothetical protein